LKKKVHFGETKKVTPTARTVACTSFLSISRER
jgi:hypothetical protein